MLRANRTLSCRNVAGLLVALAISAVLPLAALSQGTFGIDALFKLLGHHDALRATFVERKFVKQLDGPVDSSGELSFDAPATMVKRTLKPRPETVRMDGQKITVERGSQQRTFSIDEHPEIAVYVEAIRAALAGDQTALQRYYEPSVEGGAASWKLTLAPRDPKLAQQVTSIILSGKHGTVRQVEVRLADGDYSVMSIEPAAK